MKESNQTTSIIKVVNKRLMNRLSLSYEEYRLGRFGSHSDSNFIVRVFNEKKKFRQQLFQQSLMCKRCQIFYHYWQGSCLVERFPTYRDFHKFRHFIVCFPRG